MEDDKIYACFGVATLAHGIERLEPEFKMVLLVFQLIISALTIALLYRKLRSKKK